MEGELKLEQKGQDEKAGKVVGEAAEPQATKVQWRSKWDQKGEAEALRLETQKLQNASVISETQKGQVAGLECVNEWAKEGQCGEMQALRIENLLSNQQHTMLLLERQQAHVAGLAAAYDRAVGEQRALAGRCEWAESELQAMKTLCDSLSQERDRLQRQVHASQQELEAAKAAPKADLEAAKAEREADAEAVKAACKKDLEAAKAACQAELEAVKAAYQKHFEAAKGEAAAANKLLAVAKNVSALKLKRSKAEAEAATRLREESEEALEAQKKACREMSNTLAMLRKRDTDVTARLSKIGAKLGIEGKAEGIQVAVVSLQSALESAKKRVKELERKQFDSEKHRKELRKVEDRAKQLERISSEQEKLLQEGKALLEKKQQSVQDLKAEVKAEKEKRRVREDALRVELTEADARIASLEGPDFDSGAQKQSLEARKAREELEEGEVAPELPDLLQDERESEGRTGSEASEPCAELELGAVVKAEESRNEPSGGVFRGNEESEAKLAAERQRLAEVEKELQLERQWREGLEGALRAAEVERSEELIAREAELFEEVELERQRREFVEREMAAAEAGQMEELEARERELREAR